MKARSGSAAENPRRRRTVGRRRREDGEEEDGEEEEREERVRRRERLVVGAAEAIFGERKRVVRVCLCVLWSGVVGLLLKCERDDFDWVFGERERE